MSLNSRLKKLESRKTTKAPNLVIFRTILDGGNGKPIVRSPGPACICGTEFTHIMPNEDEPTDAFERRVYES